jgi:hypothetical protein
MKKYYFNNLDIHHIINEYRKISKKTNRKSNLNLTNIIFNRNKIKNQRKI